MHYQLNYAVESHNGKQTSQSQSNLSLNIVAQIISMAENAGIEFPTLTMGAALTLQRTTALGKEVSKREIREKFCK